MLKPEHAEALPFEVEKLMRELETRVMSDVVSRISMTKDISRTADWQLLRLYELGKSKSEIRSIVAYALKKSDVTVKEAFEEVLRQGYANDKNLYSLKGKKLIPYNENDELRQLVSALSEQTQNEFKNITASLGFATYDSNGAIKFTPIADYYQKVLDGAVLDISTGVFDYNTVLKRIVKEMTNSGLRTVDYATGYSNRIDVAARRALMTGIGQLTGKISEDNAKELETEFFEITWHSGARPEHQVWQGRVFSKEELVTVCGYGTGPGLKGWNCRHDFFPFIKGVSVRTYTDEQLEKMNAEENTLKEYGGKQYTKYQATQRQRKLETRMRAQRQQIKLLKDGGADEDDLIATRAKYRNISSEYTKFSKHFNLPEQRQRITVDGLGNIGQGKWKVNSDSMARENVYTGSTWKKTGKKITAEQLEALESYAEKKNIKLKAFKNFDGDINLVYEAIDEAAKIADDFPKLKSGKTQLQIHNDYKMHDEDFAETIGNKIKINNYAFRDRDLLEKEYQKLVDEGWFVKGTTHKSIIAHEMGHVVKNVYQLPIKQIAEDAYNMNLRQLAMKAKRELSRYAGSNEKCSEVISEAFSSVYTSNIKNDFALNFLQECGKIIARR